LHQIDDSAGFILLNSIADYIGELPTLLIVSQKTDVPRRANAFAHPKASLSKSLGSSSGWAPGRGTACWLLQ